MVLILLRTATRFEIYKKSNFLAEKVYKSSLLVIIVSFLPVNPEHSSICIGFDSKWVVYFRIFFNHSKM
jgi:hypothetical protein